MLSELADRRARQSSLRMALAKGNAIGRPNPTWYGLFPEFGTLYHDGSDTRPGLYLKNFGLTGNHHLMAFPRRRLLRARKCFRPNQIPETLQGPRVLATRAHKISNACSAPHAIFKGCREWRIDSTRFPNFDNSTGVNPRSRTVRGLRELFIGT